MDKRDERRELIEIAVSLLRKADDILVRLCRKTDDIDSPPTHAAADNADPAHSTSVQGSATAAPGGEPKDRVCVWKRMPDDYFTDPVYRPMCTDGGYWTKVGDFCTFCGGRITEATFCGGKIITEAT